MANPPNLWRGAALFLLAVVALQVYLIAYQPAVPHVPGLPTGLVGWGYTPERDHQNIALAGDQCDIAFPNLYFEIERAAKHWEQKQHQISPQDISIDWRKDAALQALIVNNQLRILRTKETWQARGYRKRALPLLAQIHRALLGATAAGEVVPNIEFAAVVDDMSSLPRGPEHPPYSAWTFTRHLTERDEDKLWVIPDFNFFVAYPRAPAFIEQQRRAAENDGPLKDKFQKVVWRGAEWTNKEVRGALLNVTAGKDWADVEAVDWKDPNNHSMKMEDMCKYMFTVHTEGRSWSGRLKFLLNCDSVPIVHELRWAGEFYHLLQADGPRQNYIPVHRNFSDLEEKVKYYLDHPDEAQRIADNAVTTFRSRYTSPAAESCYWRRLFKRYSDVAFVPEPFETVTRNMSGVEIQDRQLRGITYEEMLLWEGEDDYPTVG